MVMGNENKFKSIHIYVLAAEKDNRVIKSLNINVTLSNSFKKKIIDSND